MLISVEKTEAVVVSLNPRETAGKPITANYNSRNHAIYQTAVTDNSARKEHRLQETESLEEAPQSKQDTQDAGRQRLGNRRYRPQTTLQSIC